MDALYHTVDRLSYLLRDYDPLHLAVTVALGAVTVGYTACYVVVLNRTEKSIYKRARDSFFKLIRRIPFVKRLVKEEIDKVRADLMHSIHGEDTRANWFACLPKDGLPSTEVIRLASDDLNSNKVPAYLDGRVSGAVFNNERDKEEMELYKEIFSQYAYSNPLWPKLYPKVRKMEAEVVRMACDLLGGDDQTCGTMSTGGTISILLACLAHRNRALARGVVFPEMILPSSAHAAFYKASELFRIKAVKIPVDERTFRVDVAKMRKAINSRTCMLAGSAPNFPFGSVDDIEAIGRLGAEYDIPVHVDACLGGFLLPFLASPPRFDFRVPGVCSISADTHKYGLTPKGSSVVLYRNEEYRRNQYFGDADWQGGIYASSTMEGSRSGMMIALTWSSMLYHGRGYYTEHAELIQEVTRKIRRGIEEIPEFRIQGGGDVCIVNWTSDSLDIYRFHDLIGTMGWQLGAMQFPNGVHIMVTQLHTAPGLAEEFLKDVWAVVEQMRKTPNEKPTGQAAIYGMAQKIPDRSLVKDLACTYLDACYSMPEH